MNSCIIALIHTRTVPWYLTFFLIFFMTMCGSPAQAAYGKFPAPGWLGVVLIADEMVINGLPSQVQTFTSDKSIDTLLDFYRKRWLGTPAYKESRAVPWHIIAKYDGRFLYTVQVRQENTFRISGYLAMADLQGMQEKKRQKETVPQMSGTAIVNDSTTHDSDRTGRALILTNSYSTESNSLFYRNYYADRGWEKLMDTGSNDATVMSFSKGEKETRLVIGRHNGATQIIMNTTEEN